MNIVIETFFAGSKEHFSSFLYELGLINFFDNIFAYAYERWFFWKQIVQCFFLLEK